MGDKPVFQMRWPRGNFYLSKYTERFLVLGEGCFFPWLPKSPVLAVHSSCTVPRAGKEEWRHQEAAAATHDWPLPGKDGVALWLLQRLKMGGTGVMGRKSWMRNKWELGSMFWVQEWAHSSMGMLQGWCLAGAFHCHRNGTEGQPHPLPPSLSWRGVQQCPHRSICLFPFCFTSQLPGRQSRGFLQPLVAMRSVFLLDDRNQIVPWGENW